MGLLYIDVLYICMENIMPSFTSEIKIVCGLR